MYFESMKKTCTSFQYAEMWLQATNQSPKPNLTKDKSLTCVLLGINGLSSRSRAQKSHMLQSALQGTQQWDMQYHNPDIFMKKWSVARWTQQKTNRLRAHLEVHNPVDSGLDPTILEGRTSAELMWRRTAWWRFWFEKEWYSNPRGIEKYKEENLRSPKNHRYWLLQIKAESQGKRRSKSLGRDWALLMRISLSWPKVTWYRCGSVLSHNKITEVNVLCENVTISNEGMHSFCC